MVKHTSSIIDIYCSSCDVSLFGQVISDNYLATIKCVRSGMATIHLQPPEHFDFKSPDGWPKWKRRFEHFRAASGLSATSAAQQVSTLLYCLGEETDIVLLSTNITEEERGVYETVMQEFDEFFQLRRNVIFERARFKQTKPAGRRIIRTIYFRTLLPGGQLQLWESERLITKRQAGSGNQGSRFVQKATIGPRLNSGEDKEDH